MEPSVGAHDADLIDEGELVFEPYYIRSNGGGKGHMRVGLLEG